MLKESTRFKKEKNTNFSRWKEKFKNYEKEYHQDPINNNYYVHFADVEKIGINPTNIYNTPTGFYAYPIGLIKKFASDRENIIIFKPKYPERILSLKKYNNEQFNRDTKKLLEIFNDSLTLQDIQDFLRNSSTRKIERYDIGAIFWRLVRKLAKNQNQWTKIFLLLGYDGVEDDLGSVIHPNEPRQAVFFRTPNLQIIDILKQPKKKENAEMLKENKLTNRSSTHTEYHKDANDKPTNKISREVHHFDKNMHNEAGPSDIQYDKDGNIIEISYIVNGKLHRLDGPAKVIYFPTKNRKGKLIKHRELYYNNGEPHNTKGPAIKVFDQTGKLIKARYCLNGNTFQNKEDWKKMLNKNTLKEGKIISSGSATNLEVRKIFDNTAPSYLEKTLQTRNPPGTGSEFLKVLSLDDLKNANWKKITHPAVRKGTDVYVTQIPGKLGIIKTELLPPEMPVKFQLSHGGTGGKSGKAAELVADFPDNMATTKQTFLITGPSHPNFFTNDKNGHIVYTFHPGPPITNDKEFNIDEIKNKLGSLTTTAGVALSMGFKYAKKVNNLQESKYGPSRYTEYYSNSYQKPHKKDFHILMKIKNKLLKESHDPSKTPEPFKTLLQQLERIKVEQTLKTSRVNHKNDKHVFGYDLCESLLRRHLENRMGFEMPPTPDFSKYLSDKITNLYNNLEKLKVVAFINQLKLDYLKRHGDYDRTWDTFLREFKNIKMLNEERKEFSKFINNKFNLFMKNLV